MFDLKHQCSRPANIKANMAKADSFSTFWRSLVSSNICSGGVENPYMDVEKPYMDCENPDMDLENLHMDLENPYMVYENPVSDIENPDLVSKIWISDA